LSPKLGGCAATRYGCCPDGKTGKVDQNGSNCPLSLSSSFNRMYDQILSGDVTIKKVSSDDYTHKITFSKKNISKVLLYQIWSDSSAELNSNRVVKEVKATTWVNLAFPKNTPNPDCFCTQDYNPVICDGIIYSNSCHASCAGQTNCVPFTIPIVPFTPTTVMELDMRNRYVFVIKRALVNKCGQVVFYVSSEDIVLPSNPCLKRLKTIPTGSFCKARFDIDGLTDTTPPYTKFNDCVDIDIQNQTVFFDSTSNSASTITLKANSYLKSLLVTEGLLINIFILPVNNSIDDIKYEWQYNNAYVMMKWVLIDSYVLTDSLKKVIVTSVEGLSFQDNVGIYIGENLLSSSSKGFIVFKRPTTGECVGRCYVSLY
jgi:hypothetical protein